MSPLLFLLLLPLPIFADRAFDPSPGLWESPTDVRNRECSRMSQARAHELYPGHVPEPPARGSFGDIDALVCTSRTLPLGERQPRDEAILSSLRRTAGEIAQVATATALASENLTWHVDAFYPDPAVAAKIAVATRTELAERGRRVSDRVPVLAAGDVAMLARLPPQKAFPLACTRYFAEVLLGETEAFLAVTLVDARETELHAGFCRKGVWRWLR